MYAHSIQIIISCQNILVHLLKRNQQTLDVVIYDFSYANYSCDEKL